MTLVIDITCKGSSAGQRVLLEDGDTLNVGRANETLGLGADPRLSRKHFILRYCNREIEITHLSKTNPTLVAGEGSTDFAEVTGKQVEPHGCRIIAGSHRFVALVEAPDSIIEPTLSGEDQAEIWSDVDSEDAGNQFFFDSFPEQEKEVHPPEAALAHPTMPNAVTKPIPASAVTQADSVEPKAMPGKSAISSEDSDRKPPANSDDPRCTEPKSPPAPKSPDKPAPSKAPDLAKTDKKIFFPIEDDFFD